MLYAIFLCMHFTATPQLDSCEIRKEGCLGVDTSTPRMTPYGCRITYYQTVEECKKAAGIYHGTAILGPNDKPPQGTQVYQQAVCMGKPTWQPVH